VSLLEKLKAGKRNVRELPFPGTEQTVILQVLNSQDLQDAIFAAERRFKGAEMETSGTAYDAYQAERATQILFRALRDPEDPKKPLAATADEMRKLLQNEETELLLKEYLDFERECSPNILKMTDEDFEALWEDIKKNPLLSSSSLSSAALRGLITFLASRPAKSQTDSGST
jgi:hypothetical protein